LASLGRVCFFSRRGAWRSSTGDGRPSDGQALLPAARTLGAARARPRLGCLPSGTIRIKEPLRSFFWCGLRCERHARERIHICTYTLYLHIFIYIGVTGMLLCEAFRSTCGMSSRCCVPGLCLLTLPCRQSPIALSCMTIPAGVQISLRAFLSKPGYTSSRQLVARVGVGTGDDDGLVSSPPLFQYFSGPASPRFL